MSPDSATPGVPTRSLPSSHRIKSSDDFRRVYDSKAFAADEVLVINGCRNDLPHARLGLSVSRRVGNAVVRNRWKRLIREAFRLQRSKLPIGIDYVARPRRGASPNLEAIAMSLPRLARRIESLLNRRKQDS